MLWVRVLSINSMFFKDSASCDLPHVFSLYRLKIRPELIDLIIFSVKQISYQWAIYVPKAKQIHHLRNYECCSTITRQPWQINKNTVRDFGSMEFFSMILVRQEIMKRKMGYFLIIMSMPLKKSYEQVKLWMQNSPLMECGWYQPFTYFYTFLISFDWNIFTVFWGLTEHV